MSDSYVTKPKLLVMGDALRDIYMHGSWSPISGALRFKPEDILEFDGGAANTLANARAILEDKADVIGWMNKEPLRLYRFIDQEVRESYVQVATDSCLTLPKVMHQTMVDGIIISDYNKGTVNKAMPHLVPLSPWIIVDSRYRSLHLDFLKLGRTRIWRCTGDEFDGDWALNFHYTLRTNAAETIHLMKNDEGKLRLVARWNIPQIPIVDTCGAGDTFTAMLGSWLVINRRIADPYMADNKLTEFDWRLIKAVPACITAAQEVCMKKYTAITTERL